MAATMWTDEQIEVWVLKRFGLNTNFNRQFIKDLLNDFIKGIECAGDRQ